MTIIKHLDDLKNWLETEICSQFKFKQANDENVDSTYNYNLVNPSVFILYVPPKEFIGDKNRVPSICIQFEDGNENLKDEGGSLNVRLQFSTFNPGEHTEEGFTTHTEGWRDVWNLIDHTMRLIRDTETINGLRIIKENGIKYGPISDAGQIPDFYPYYFAWLEFSVEYGVTSSKAEVLHLL